MRNHCQGKAEDGSSDPLISEFAADSEMIELVEYFIGELQERVVSLRDVWEMGDSVRLRAMAHQLKGAAGGYGFPSITTSAAELESCLRAEEAEVSSISEKLESLISLCNRAVAGKESLARRE